jgi:antitoxin (DNA-binding transcriptional repressor) of toxin-antitoxin stability system
MVARKSIDVSANSELKRIAEEVAASGRKCTLSVEGQDVAEIVPLPKTRRLNKASSDERLASFMASAGSWKGLIDGDEFKRQIRRSRSVRSHRTITSL